MKYDVLIIGSGLGGLECAQILARAGKSVMVLERQSQPGGCLASYRRRNHTFDTGLHYVGGLTEGGELHAVFDYLGLLELPWQRLDADGFDRVTIGDETFAFAEGYDHFADTLGQRFPKERQALKRYADLLRQTDSQHFVIENIAPLIDKNAYDYLCETFSDPLLINVLSGTSLKIELRRESLPLFSFLHGNASYVNSSWRLRGDGNLLIQALTEGIRHHGGALVCNAEVSQLIEKDGRITAAVCTDGTTYEADMFISDVHPTLTLEWIGNSPFIKERYRRRIARMQNTFGFFTASLVLKPKSLPYFNHNHYIYRQPNVWSFYEEEGPVGGVMVSCRVPTDGTTFASQVDLLTPMPWHLCAPWADTHVGHRGADYEALKQRMADECIALASRVLPTLPDCISECYTSTPLTYRDYTLAPQGTAYGLRKDCRNPLLTILSPHTVFPNLLLTGQNLMLHGLHGVTMTALETCSAAIGKDYIDTLFQR